MQDAPAVEIARAHHGSLAREERTKVEELLKAGGLPCLVATSSLELGIDMGAVDLVLQVESPKSVARGLQRIGRAGHGVGEVSRGRIFPKFRGDLLECAVLARRMREGEIESTVVPRNALDVLAQQIVAIAASAARRGRSTVAELLALVRALRTPTPSCRCELLENVLDMLDGRYPSREFGELRARIVWDRVAGVIRARKGARQLAIANAGTIPDRGLYAVTLPDGRRVGELDEEMVYEARPGAGVPARRLDLADRGDHARPRDRDARRPARPARSRSGRATRSGARRSSARRSAPSRAGPSSRTRETLERDYDLDRRAAAATCSPTCASSRQRRACSRASARSCSSASATRSATGACACSRRSEDACTPPGGSRCRHACSERFGVDCRRDLDRRRDHHAPARPRRRGGRVAAVGGRAVDDRAARRSRRRSSPSSAARRCSGRAFARTPLARC